MEHNEDNSVPNPQDAPSTKLAVTASRFDIVQIRNFVAFYLLGTINNLLYVAIHTKKNRKEKKIHYPVSYVVIGSAAQSIVLNFRVPDLIGLITWANIAFGLFAQGNTTHAVRLLKEIVVVSLLLCSAERVLPGVRSSRLSCHWILRGLSGWSCRRGLLLFHWLLVCNYQHHPRWLSVFVWRKLHAWIHEDLPSCNGEWMVLWNRHLWLWRPYLPGVPDHESLKHVRGCFSCFANRKFTR